MDKTVYNLWFLQQKSGAPIYGIYRTECWYLSATSELLLEVEVIHDFMTRHLLKRCHLSRRRIPQNFQVVQKLKLTEL